MEFPDRGWAFYPFTLTASYWIFWNFHTKRETQAGGRQD
jgi:hypothetical protein